MDLAGPTSRKRDLGIPELMSSVLLHLGSLGKMLALDDLPGFGASSKWKIRLGFLTHTPSGMSLVLSTSRGLTWHIHSKPEALQSV